MSDIFEIISRKQNTTHRPQLSNQNNNHISHNTEQEINDWAAKIPLQIGDTKVALKK